MVNAVITESRVCLATEVRKADEQNGIPEERVMKSFEVSEEIFEKMTHPEDYPNFSWSMIGDRIDILEKSTL